LYTNKIRLTEATISAIRLRYPTSERLAMDVRDRLERMEALIEFLLSRRSAFLCLDFVNQNTIMNTIKTNAMKTDTKAPTVTESVVQANGSILILGSKIIIMFNSVYC